MKRSMIARRACFVGAAIAILALAPATPSQAGMNVRSRGCCDGPQAPSASADTQYPYSSGGNPMGIRDRSSPEQNAEEGTLGQGRWQVNAEVGAGEHDVLRVDRSATQPSAAARWVMQSLVILLAVAVASMGFRLIFLPSDRVRRKSGKE